jgi:hypothetical protein
MKKQIFFFCALFLATAVTVTMNSCSKDDNPKALTLSTLVAGDVDMNGATAPNNVAAEPTIVATFSTNVDATSATASNIILKRDYDDATIATTITVSGATITIVPTEMLASGALHELTFSTGLKSTGDQMLTAAVVRTFSTDGFFAPSGMVAYWKFEDNASDQVGSFNPSANIDVTYAAGRKTAAGKAAVFNGTSSIIEIPNGDQLMSKDFTLSFWVKAETSGKGHFVMGLGAYYGFQFEIFGDFGGCKLAGRYELADGTTASEDLWFPANGNVDFAGWTFCADYAASGGLAARLQDKWAHIVCIYNSTTKIGKMYVNGELAKSQDFNLWDVTDVKHGIVGMKYGGVEPDVKNELAFGFVQSRAGTMWDAEPWGGYDFPTANHFKGQLDDVRIFNKPISEAEVQLMYNSEKP